MSTFLNYRRFLLARITAGVRECAAVYGLCCIGKCALVAWDCGVIAGLQPVLRVENCFFILVYDSTPLIRLHLAFHEDFHNSAAPVDDLILSIVRGSHRRCNCDSSQKYMRACYKFPYIRTYLSVWYRAVGTFGDATWLP